MAPVIDQTIQQTPAETKRLGAVDQGAKYAEEITKLIENSDIKPTNALRAVQSNRQATPQEIANRAATTPTGLESLGKTPSFERAFPGAKNNISPSTLTQRAVKGAQQELGRLRTAQQGGISTVQSLESSFAAKAAVPEVARPVAATTDNRAAAARQSQRAQMSRERSQRRAETVRQQNLNKLRTEQASEQTRVRGDLLNDTMLLGELGGAAGSLSPFFRTDIVDNTLQSQVSAAGVNNSGASVNSLNARDTPENVLKQADGLSALYGASKVRFAQQQLQPSSAKGLANSGMASGQVAGGLSEGATAVPTKASQTPTTGSSRRATNAAKLARLVSEDEVLGSNFDVIYREELAMMKSLSGDLSDGAKKLASLQSARDFELQQIFAFRDGATQKTAKRKFAVYHGFSLLSHMIAFWMILREAHDKILEDLEKLGLLGEVPPSLDMGDFLREFVEAYERAQNMIDGMPAEDARLIKAIGDSIDFDALKEKAGDIRAAFEKDLGGALDFNAHERPRYVVTGGPVNKNPT